MRYEDEASRALVVRLVERVEEAGRDESRQNRFGCGRPLDDDLSAVTEAEDVEGRANDVSGEVSTDVLELGSRPESSSNRPGARAPAALQVESREPLALQDDETRPVECRAEDARSADCEGPTAAAGR